MTTTNSSHLPFLFGSGVHVPIVNAFVPRGAEASDSASIDVAQSKVVESSKNTQPPYAASSRLGVFSSLLLALRAKHAPTASHCIRVAQGISAWGIFHQIAEHDLERLELAGLLHDLGKIGIPERILQKPTQLTSEERAIIDLHPRVGIDILHSAGVETNILESIANLGIWFDQHNCESPSHLPIAQRILAIVDAFDAMTSEQVYRDAMSKESALQELGKMSGSQFDPALVASFDQMVRNSDESLYAAVAARWQNYERLSLTHMFQSTSSPVCNSSPAIESFNQVFHRSMMNRMNDGVIFVDTEFRILEWNQAAERLTGLKRSTVLHVDWSPKLIGLCDEGGLLIDESHCPVHSALQKQATEILRYRIESQDGRLTMVECQTMPIFDDRGVLLGGAMILGDASSQVSMEVKMQELHTRATQDPLTKIANRTELNRQMETLVQNCQQNTINGSVIICDIDYFKRINDTFGHSAGDEALIAFASILKENSRQSDLVARYGGEEFVILCGDCDLESAKVVAETIRESLHQRPLPALKGKTLSASFGVSQICPGDAFDTALDRADRALLKAKQTGRDKVVSLSLHESVSVAEQPSTTKENDGTTWLSWLVSGAGRPLVETELLTNLPRDVVIEKLKGFIEDGNVDVVDINQDGVRLRVDTRYAPMLRRDSDRPAIFAVNVFLQDVDLSLLGRQGQMQRITKFNLQIVATRHRDRRSDNIIDQANRLFKSFASYMTAYEITEALRERLIPVYVPDADGR